MSAADIIQKYISFFQKNGHVQIENTPLVPKDDPSTLFTSAGMQPLIPYLLGQPHPKGKRLVNVQNCFRAVDIDEVGDNRHGTFFRMLGNWSLGDYFKREEIPWLWGFLKDELGLPKEKLFITVFEGYKELPKDEEAEKIWTELLKREGLNPQERIFYYGDNWWSRSGGPDKMPPGEPGGPDTEVFYKFDKEHDPKFGNKCHPNCECGAFMEIANSVFMQYIKQEDGSFKNLPKPNVDFGGGLERLLCAVNNDPDIFRTSLLAPIIQSIEHTTGKSYSEHSREMRIIADHLVSASFLISAGVYPSNKAQGYVLRRLIRRAYDNLQHLNYKDFRDVLFAITKQYEATDPYIRDDKIVQIIDGEITKYHNALTEAKSFLEKKHRRTGDELMGNAEISAEDAFVVYTTHGLSPTQIKSLGFVFDEQKFAELLKEHQLTSKKGAGRKFERKAQKA